MDLSAILTPQAELEKEPCSLLSVAMDWFPSYAHDTHSPSNDSFSDTKSDNGDDNNNNRCPNKSPVLAPQATTQPPHRNKVFKFHLARHNALRPHLPRLPSMDWAGNSIFQTAHDPMASARPYCFPQMPRFASPSPSIRQNSLPTQGVFPEDERIFRFAMNKTHIFDMSKKAHKRARSPEPYPRQKAAGITPTQETCKKPSTATRRHKKISKASSSSVASAPQQQPSTQASAPKLPPSKKAKTDAAMAYDNVNLSLSDDEFFGSTQKPSMEVFEKKPSVRVLWKGSPLNISQQPFYDMLHPGEAHIASILRLTPEQFIRCKRVLVQAAQDYASKDMPFRKSDAQKLCRIDVNKVSTLWSVFGRLGWLGPKWSRN